METKKLKVSFEDLISEVLEAKSDNVFEQLIKKEIVKSFEDKSLSTKKFEDLDEFLREKTEIIKRKWMENINLKDNEKEMYGKILDVLENIGLDVNESLNKYTKRNWKFFYIGVVIALLSYFLPLLMPSIFSISFFMLFFTIGMIFAIKGGIFIAELHNLKDKHLKESLKKYLENVGVKNFNYTKFKLSQLKHKGSENLSEQEMTERVSKIIANMTDNENVSDLDKIVEYLLPMINR